MIAMLGDGIHGILRPDGKPFYLDDTAGIHGGFHVVTGDAVFLFIIIDRKISATGAGVFGAPRMKIDRGHGSAFEQAGRVDPGRDK